MRQDSYQRKLDKKVNNTIRDGEGGIGNARGAVKANRALSKAIIESALDEQNDEEQSLSDECIICSGLSKSATCSSKCFDEAVALGLLNKE